MKMCGNAGIRRDEERRDRSRSTGRNVAGGRGGARPAYRPYPSRGGQY